MAFSSHLKVLANRMGPVESSSGHEEALFSLENHRGRVFFIPKSLGDLFLTIIAIS